MPKLPDRNDCLADALDLTSDLRNDEDETWSTIRRILSEKSIEIDKVLLAAFVEGENGEEYGLLVNQDTCYEFKRIYGETSLSSWVEGVINFKVFTDKLYVQYIDWCRDFQSEGLI